MNTLKDDKGAESIPLSALRVFLLRLLAQSLDS